MEKGFNIFGNDDYLSSFSKKEGKTIVTLCLIIQLLKIIEEKEKRNEDFN